MDIQQIPEASAQGEAKQRSLRGAINAFCKYCIYDPKGTGTWRQQVEACTSTKCPLYEYRPVSATAQPENGPEQPLAEGGMYPHTGPMPEPAPVRVHSSADDLAADVLA